MSLSSDDCEAWGVWHLRCTWNQQRPLHLSNGAITETQMSDQTKTDPTLAKNHPKNEADKSSTSTKPVVHAHEESHAGSCCGGAKTTPMTTDDGKHVKGNSPSTSDSGSSAKKQ